MKAKFLIFICIALLLIGCENPKAFNLKNVEDYFDLLEDEHDNIIETNSMIVSGGIIFEIYFSSESLTEEIESILEEASLFLSDDELLLEIREYYANKNNIDKIESCYPTLTLIYKKEDETYSDFDYFNSKEHFFDENRKQQIRYRGWEKSDN